MKHFLIVSFLFFYFVISLFTYKDFGPTGDERAERRAAHDLYVYIKQPTSYDSIIDKRYEDAVNFPLGHHPLITKYQRSYQLIQYIVNQKGYYEWDHLFNMIFGSVFFIALYALFYLQYKSTYKAIIPVIFLALTPRLMGHIPANNKDMPFAAMYLIGMGAIYLLGRYPINNYLRIIILGLIFGLLSTFRTIGFSIYIVYVIYHFYLLWMDNKKINLKHSINYFAELFIIFIFGMFVSVSMFPWLGANFFANFKELLLNSKRFQLWDDTIFFAAEFLKKTDRPWYYLFTWLFITTPVFILTLFVVPIIFIKKLFKNQLFILALVALVINLFLYLILQPVIYNGLRHFLFLLPIVVIISSMGFLQVLQISNKTYFKILLIALLGINSTSIIYNYLTLHPYEYLYFNELIDGLKGASGKYELDYWGASYKEATEWLVNNNELTHSDLIYACNVDWSVDYYSQKEFFITYGSDETANYTICDTENELKRGYTGEIIYQVKRQGVVLNTIRKH